MWKKEPTEKDKRVWSIFHGSGQSSMAEWLVEIWKWSEEVDDNLHQKCPSATRNTDGIRIQADCQLIMESNPIVPNDSLAPLGNRETPTKKCVIPTWTSLSRSMLPSHWVCCCSGILSCPPIPIFLLSLLSCCPLFLSFSSPRLHLTDLEPFSFGNKNRWRIEGMSLTTLQGRFLSCSIPITIRSVWSIPPFLRVAISLFPSVFVFF